MSTVPTSPAQTRVHIRWMIRRDMPEVLAIEHASFEYPWCEEEFLRVLRQRNCIGMVAEHGERIVGFMIYELHRNKIHVLDFATHRRISSAGSRAADDRQAGREALQPASQPHRASRPRDEPPGPVVLSRRWGSARWKSCGNIMRTLARTPTRCSIISMNH